MYISVADSFLGCIYSLFFQNYTEILSDLDILRLICRTYRHESLKAVMSCSRRVIFSHSRENDSIITVLFPDCKEYCYINMIYQNHIYGEKFMIQNYILLFFEYNLQEESTPGSSRKAPEKAYPASHFSAVLSVQKARGTVFSALLT